MAAIVTAEGLHKSFARRGSMSPPVLDKLDLELEEGSVLALLGPNGAGKTTTVRILSTLLRPDAGRATVAGFDVVRDARRVREIISLTGQQVAVDDKLSGTENLTMMGHLAHLPRRVVRGRVAELLTAFDLADAAHRQVGTWSGGMRRRLDLAAGLLTRPRVMFLDEPTTGLDPRSRQALWDVVRGVVEQGTSVFLTTQYLEEADRLAQRVALVDGGRVVAEGTPAQLKREVGDAGVELTFASASDAGQVAPAVAATADGARVRVPTDGSVAHVRSVLSVVEATGVTPDHWEVRAPTLDDVFLALTGHVGQEHSARPAGVAA
ncbi:ABC-2 type transport system ATP-binding protein [Promicromonospora umidemergens]|uniref:Daunorubicin resistance protein DrrA family ABC transporter ATP-binding protein n=1 Tax=Promicromonospora umidemergens TaxID=629679 RepID=A0ABP8XU29_9MICO|nr:ATP-binding cassette domain-containing protein [Promicromonospora umidemergens]MCP2286437.1 ABC-2 type transport system ATP-binding protein [Promicromonospora umidemergens]